MKSNALSLMVRLIVVFALLVFVVAAYGAYKMMNLALPQAYPLASDLTSPLQVDADMIKAISSDDFVSRPLFWEERRMVEGVAAEVPKPVNNQRDPFREFKLLGIYLYGDQAGVIANINGIKQRIRVEEEYEGWQLAFMSPDSAVFTKGDENKVVPLEHASIVIAPPASAGRTLVTPKAAPGVNEKPPLTTEQSSKK